MLSIHNLSKSFGVKPILQDVSFSIKTGERAALVGENGSGKTTLLNIITGQLSADSGHVQLTPASLRVGHLPQGLLLDEELTISEYLNQFMGSPDLLADQVAELSLAMSAKPEKKALQKAYDQALAKLIFAQENQPHNREIIRELGLEGIPPERQVHEISGGQKTRLALAGVLMNQPDTLLLDEPTNHLDLEMLGWLEDWLAGFPGSVLLVSHDRAFLDKVATTIIELDKDTHQVQSYPGNYSDYLEQRVAEREKERAAYTDQQESIAQLTRAAKHVRSQAKFRKGGKADPENTDKFSAGHFANRSKMTMSRAKNLEKRLEKLLGEDRIEKPRENWQMKLEFENTPESSQQVLVLDNLAIGYDGRPVLEGINLEVLAGKRVALIGENGSGKSTLLKTIAGQVPALEGQIRLGPQVKAGYLAQAQDTLSSQMTPVGTIQAIKPMNEGKARSFLHKFLFTTDEVFSRIENLSYGERSRLMLACLVIQECNFLLLDEPINHLDIPSRTRFEQALADFPGTVLMVVHDRYFLSHYAEIVWKIKDGRFRVEYPQVF